MEQQINVKVNDKFLYSKFHVLRVVIISGSQGN